DMVTQHVRPGLVHVLWVGVGGIRVPVFAGLVNRDEHANDRWVPLHVGIANHGGRNAIVVVSGLGNDDLAALDPFGGIHIDNGPGGAELPPVFRLLHQRALVLVHQRLGSGVPALDFAPEQVHLMAYLGAVDHSALISTGRHDVAR